MAFQPGNNLGRGPYHHKRPRIVTQRLIAMLNETDENNIPKLHRFANALFNKALEGDVTAIKEVIDRVEGKVPQPIAGDPDNPLVIDVTVIRENRKARSNRASSMLAIPKPLEGERLRIEAAEIFEPTAWRQPLQRRARRPGQRQVPLLRRTPRRPMHPHSRPFSSLHP